LGSGITTNHGKNGQNVLELTGRVTFEESSLCGVDNDHIWSRRDAGGGLKDYKTDRPADADDTRLVP